MNIREIQSRLAGGFTPFTIRILDGSAFPVPHKEFIFVTARSVVVADEKGYVSVLDPLHILAIQQAGSLPAK